MTTSKWTINTKEQQDLCYPGAKFRFNEKGVFAGVGVEILEARELATYYIIIT